MEKRGTYKLAAVLRTLVMLVFGLNLLCLLLVPGLACIAAEGGPGFLRHYLVQEVANGYVVHTLGRVGIFFAFCFTAVWTDMEAVFLTVYFWGCGLCTACILWQAKSVLDTILCEEPFQMRNAVALRRAALCCWIISGGALVRLLIWLCWEGNLYPLFTYTALFVPAFFMAGLLFLVMSALFRQAAELKEDQDLTI